MAMAAVGQTGKRPLGIIVFKNVKEAVCADRFWKQHGYFHP